MDSAKNLINAGVKQVSNLLTGGEPTSSASNVINYDPEKSGLDNMLQYAMDNNSASAYSSFLENKYQQDLADSVLSRSIADAERNGISKYQLFQSGNLGAASPSSAGSTFESYENAMERKSGWNKALLSSMVKILTNMMTNSARSFGDIIKVIPFK